MFFNCSYGKELCLQQVIHGLRKLKTFGTLPVFHRRRHQACQGAERLNHPLGKFLKASGSGR